MAANFKVFVDGNRLPAEDIMTFLARQTVVQVDGQNDLADLVQYGVRMAITTDTGEIWFWTDLGGWSPLDIDGLLTLDEADARYLTQITAEGIFLKIVDSADFVTGDEVAATYLAKLDATGLYLTKTEAQQDYLGKTEASTTYETIINAGSIYLSKTDASNTYLTQSGASSTYITQIDAGSLFVSKGGAATDINNNTTTINGGKITTGTISASAISAGTLTGFRIQTSSSGKRILISESSNSIVMYNDSGTIVGRIQAGVAGTVLDIKGYNGVAGFEIGSASTVVDGNLSTSGSSNIFAAGRLGQYTFASLGTTTSVGRRTSDGLFGPASSDERLKENIVEINNGLELINKLRPVKFQFKTEENGPVSYGLIAQEVEPHFDENDNVVNKMTPAEDGVEYLSINYDSFIAPLISAVKELSAKNEELEARLAVLEGGNS